MSKARDGVEDLKTIDANLAAKAPLASPVFTGNVGIGVTPETDWHSSIDALQLGAGASIYGNTTATGNQISSNARATAGSSLNGYKYIATDKASTYQQYDGQHNFRVAASGSADAAISWNTAMTINNAGIVTKPFQPIVSMSRNEGALSLSSNANVFATTSITTWALQGITHNTSNGRFTLPVAGKYRVSFYSIKNGSAQAYFDLQKNGGHYGFRVYNNTTSAGWQQYSGTGVYSFAANDYLTLINVTGGTNNAHGGTHMNFAIELIG